MNRVIPAPAARKNELELSRPRLAGAVPLPKGRPVQQSLGTPERLLCAVAVAPRVTMASLAVAMQRKVELPCRGVQVSLNRAKPPIPTERARHTEGLALGRFRQTPAGHGLPHDR